MEERLINEVILEGIVVREPWKYTDDLFFRLGVYRDSDMPAKKLDAERDGGDYVNVRLSGGANGLIQIHRGMRLRVHGFLQSRDFRESLEEYLEKAHKQGNTEFQVEVSGLKSNQVLIDRNAVEIVARRLIVMDSGNTTEKKPKPSLATE
jgi:hypothetical protein